MSELLRVEQPFQVVSEFEPTGDQPKAINELLEGLEKRDKNQVLLGATGTGKTLAFLLPILEELDKNCTEIQAIIVVPTRELAIQIDQVLREMGTGFKINAVIILNKKKNVLIIISKPS